MARAHVTNQEYQNYYDWRDQQYIVRKYNGCLEQVTLELTPNIIIVVEVEEEEVEEEDGFYQWADQYDQWDSTPYTPIINDDVGDSHTFNGYNPLFNLIKNQAWWDIEKESNQKIVWIRQQVGFVY